MYHSFDPQDQVPDGTLHMDLDPDRPFSGLASQGCSSWALFPPFSTDIEQQEASLPTLYHREHSGQGRVNTWAHPLDLSF